MKGGALSLITGTSSSSMYMAQQSLAKRALPRDLHSSCNSIRYSLLYHEFNGQWSSIYAWTVWGIGACKGLDESQGPSSTTMLVVVYRMSWTRGLAELLSAKQITAFDTLMLFTLWGQSVDGSGLSQNLMCFARQQDK